MKITVTLDNHELVLKFPFNQSINDRIKSVFGWRFDGNTKTWRVHVASVYDLINEFGALLDFATPFPEIELAMTNLGPSFGTIDTTIVEDFNLPPYDYQIIGGTAFLPVVKKALLADEVGLGKTVVSLVGLQYLYNRGLMQKALVVCKASLKSQWLSEIYRFTDFEGIIIDSHYKDRPEIYEAAKDPKVNIVIINYELLTFDSKRLKKNKEKGRDGIDDFECIKEIADQCQVIIADEVHKIKNPRTYAHKNLKKLNTEYKWGLTGTPIENKPEDLFYIMSWIDPQVFGRNPMPFKHRYYHYEYGHPVGVNVDMLEDLRRRIAPYMLRRYKKDVDASFPKPTINYIYLDMDSLQKNVHELIRSDSFEMLESNVKIENKGSVLGNFILLQQVANTPELLAFSESKYGQEIYSKIVKNKKFSCPKIEWVFDFLTERNSLNSEAKTLIFTRSDDMAIMIKENLLSEFKDEEVIIYKGGLSNKQRDILVDHFNNTAKVMIATDAASEGLNLQLADIEINIDLPYNPSRLTQRIGRISRGGSQFNKVKIFNLVSKDSIDERILEIVYEKQDLFKAIIDGNVVDMKMTRSLLKKLLKGGNLNETKN